MRSHCLLDPVHMMRLLTVTVTAEMLSGGKERGWGVRRWEFKAQHFDSVMLFKMGKFYEMFEMDAHVGAEVLGLSYMKARPGSCALLVCAFPVCVWTLCNCLRN